jgi:hypothetical protein
VLWKSSDAWAPCSPEITDTRWTLKAHHGSCCSRMEQSWKQHVLF